MDKAFSRESERSLIKIRNRTVPRTLPWGHSSLNRKRRRKDSVESRAVNYETKGSQEAMCGVGFGCHW